jgi:hypothetical protein
MRNILVRRRGLRSAALMSVAAVAATGLVAAMGPANAAVTQGGGLNDQQVPNFYRDANGVALQLCVDANEALCEPAAAGHIGVYFGADATAGPMTAIYAIEAAEDEVTGEPLVSNGRRFDFDGARPNTRYKITDPWGVSFCSTDDTGRASCRKDTNGAFGTVPNGHVTTFLRPATAAGALFIGNANRTARVVGSPTGFNKLTVTGGGQTFSTTQFTLMGQKRDATAMSAVNTEALALGRPNRAEPVVRNVRYSSFGTADATPTIRMAGRNPAAFQVRNQCGAVAPGSACDIAVTFRPRQHANQTVKAVLIVDDNGLAAPRRVSLTGVGVRR